MENAAEEQQAEEQQAELKFYSVRENRWMDAEELADSERYDFSEDIAFAVSHIQFLYDILQAQYLYDMGIAQKLSDIESTTLSRLIAAILSREPTPDKPVPPEQFTKVKGRKAAKRARQASASPPIPVSDRFDALDMDQDEAVVSSDDDVELPPDTAADPPAQTRASRTVKKKKQKPATRKQTRKPRANEITIKLVLPAGLRTPTATQKSAPRARPNPAEEQCFACQGFGHRSKACKAELRCVRCSGRHKSEECERPEDVKCTCANCGGLHPANYQGCAAWKAIRAKTKKPPTSTPSVSKPPSRIAGRRALIRAVCEKMATLTESTEMKLLLTAIPRLMTDDASELAELAESLSKD